MHVCAQTSENPNNLSMADRIRQHKAMQDAAAAQLAAPVLARIVLLSIVKVSELSSCHILHFTTSPLKKKKKTAGITLIVSEAGIRATSPPYARTPFRVAGSICHIGGLGIWLLPPLRQEASRGHGLPHTPFFVSACV